MAETIPKCGLGEGLVPTKEVWEDRFVRADSAEKGGYAVNLPIYKRFYRSDPGWCQVKAHSDQPRHVVSIKPIDTESTNRKPHTLQHSERPGLLTAVLLGDALTPSQLEEPADLVNCTVHLVGRRPNVRQPGELLL